MSVPKHEEFMLPMLQLLADGRPQHIADLRDQLAQRFDLSDADRQVLLPSGRKRMFDNRVAWARVDLGFAGVVETPSRGTVRITERGRAMLAEGLQEIDRKILKRYPEFEAFMLRKRAEPVERTESTDESSDVQQGSETCDRSESRDSEVPTVDQGQGEQAGKLPENPFVHRCRCHCPGEVRKQAADALPSGHPKDP